MDKTRKLADARLMADRSADSFKALVMMFHKGLEARRWHPAAGQALVDRLEPKVGYLAAVEIAEAVRKAYKAGRCPGKAAANACYKYCEQQILKQD